MALEYDKKIFKKYRSFAITDVKDLKIGGTYYTNSYPKKFTIKEMITWDEVRRRCGVSQEYFDGKDAIEFILYDGEGALGDISLSDRNVGASYNPWFIFNDERTAKACVIELKIEYKSDGWDDDL